MGATNGIGPTRTLAWPAYILVALTQAPFVSLMCEALGAAGPRPAPAGWQMAADTFSKCLKEGSRRQRAPQSTECPIRGERRAAVVITDECALVYGGESLSLQSH